MMNYNKFLNTLKTGSTIFMIIAILLGAFGYWTVMIVLVCADILAMFAFYRCPVCHSALDPRTPIASLNYCPNCGEDLNAYQMKFRRSK